MFLEEGSNVKNFEKKWKYYFQMIWTQLITPATQSGGVRSTLIVTSRLESSQIRPVKKLNDVSEHTL